MKTNKISIVANMNKHKGKHWIDQETKTRYMDLYGITFVWDPISETWRYAEEG